MSCTAPLFGYSCNFCGFSISRRQRPHMQPDDNSFNIRATQRACMLHGAISNSAHPTAAAQSAGTLQLHNSRNVPDTRPYGVTQLGHLTDASNLVGHEAAHALSLSAAYRPKWNGYPQSLPAQANSHTSTSRLTIKEYVLRRLTKQLFGKLGRRHPQLPTYLSMASDSANIIAQHIANCRHKQPQPHLQALQEVDLNTYRICNADKNLGLTVVHRGWYNNQLRQHLSNAAVYKQVHPTVVHAHIPVLKRQLVATGYVGTNTFRGEANSQIPKFHLLPKLHKTPIGVRPICGAHSWVLTPFSQALAADIQQHMDSCAALSFTGQVLSDSEDFTHLLHKWRKIWMHSANGHPHAQASWRSSMNIWIATADVSSLYTTMPIKGAALAWGLLKLISSSHDPLHDLYAHQDAVARFVHAIAHLLRKPQGWSHALALISKQHCAQLYNLPPDAITTVTTCINHVLLLNAGNFFTVTTRDTHTQQTSTSYYQQLDGLAMGTNAAPQLANVWLAMLESVHIIPHLRKTPEALMTQATAANMHLTFYCRFIDDVFLVILSTAQTWTAAQHTISTCLNGIDPTIQMSCSGGLRAQFLDVEIHLTPHPLRLYWHPFTKHISRFLYIPPSSNHPASTFKGLYIGCAYRLASRSSTEQLYYKSLEDAAKVFHTRGHNLNAVRKHWESVSYSQVTARIHACRPRLRPRPPDDPNRIFVILPYDHRLPASLPRQIRCIWEHENGQLQPMLAWLRRHSLGSYIHRREAQLHSNST
jgi:hypothetical protein